MVIPEKIGIDQKLNVRKEIGNRSGAVKCARNS
jgi:hypothetical protein